MFKILAFAAAVTISFVCFTEPSVAQTKKGASKPNMGAQEKCFSEARKVKGKGNKDRAVAACG
jgi:hypothetical protein